jgi:hypothetical protein
MSAFLICGTWAVSVGVTGIIEILGQKEIPVWTHTLCAFGCAAVASYIALG